MKQILAIAVLLVGSLAHAQSVKLPAEVKVAVGRLAAVTVQWEGESCSWLAPPELDIFREYDPNPKVIRLRLIGYAPGRYQFAAIAAEKGGKQSEFSKCMVIVGDVPPGPTPVPPGPEPIPPTPQPPAPIPTDGMRVLVVEESADRSKLTPGQLNAMFAKSVRDYLSAKCAKGPDGKTPEVRYIDKDTPNLTGHSPFFVEAFSRPRQNLPWLIISNGVIGYEGPLPGSEAEMLDLLRKYGGK